MPGKYLKLEVISSGGLIELPGNLIDKTPSEFWMTSAFWNPDIFLISSVKLFRVFLSIGFVQTFSSNGSGKAKAGCQKKRKNEVMKKSGKRNLAIFLF